MTVSLHKARASTRNRHVHAVNYVERRGLGPALARLEDLMEYRRYSGHLMDSIEMSEHLADESALSRAIDAYRIGGRGVTCVDAWLMDEGELEWLTFSPYTDPSARRVLSLEWISRTSEILGPIEV